MSWESFGRRVWTSLSLGSGTLPSDLEETLHVPDLDPPDG